jgi:hypothetical protein
MSIPSIKGYAKLQYWRGGGTWRAIGTIPGPRSSSIRAIKLPPPASPAVRSLLPDQHVRSSERLLLPGQPSHLCPLSVQLPLLYRGHRLHRCRHRGGTGRRFFDHAARSGESAEIHQQPAYPGSNRRYRGGDLRRSYRADEAMAGSDRRPWGAAQNHGMGLRSYQRFGQLSWPDLRCGTRPSYPGHLAKSSTT